MVHRQFAGLQQDVHHTVVLDSDRTMRITVFKLMWCVQVFNTILTAEDIEAPIHGSLTLPCLHNAADVMWVEWIQNHGATDPQVVANWINDTPRDIGQWNGRTDITSAKGDLIILSLTLQDAGKYTCRYGIGMREGIGPQGPRHTGAEYNIIIDGKHSTA